MMTMTIECIYYLCNDDEYESSDEEEVQIINNEDTNLGEVDLLASATGIQLF